MFNLLAWIVYGTTTLAPGAVIDNPTPNVLGITEEVTSLPYTVPAGYNLTITDMQVEGPACNYGSASSQFGMGIWLGPLPATNAKWVASCTTVGGSNQNVNMNVNLSSGTIFNIRLMNNTSAAWVDGWYIQGVLKPN